MTWANILVLFKQTNLLFFVIICKVIDVLNYQIKYKYKLRVTCLFIKKIVLPKVISWQYYENLLTSKVEDVDVSYCFNLGGDRQTFFAEKVHNLKKFMTTETR